MGFKLKTPPSVEPITLQEAKDHLRVDVPDEDAIISELIKVAREHAENYAQRPLIAQTWTYHADTFNDIIQLKANLQTIASIKYIAPDGIQQTVPASDYVIDQSQAIGIVYPAPDKAWPDTKPQRNAVEVEFDCGYGLPAAVPSSIKSAMLLLIGHLFVNREAVTVGVSVTETPMAVELLLNPYRVNFI